MRRRLETVLLCVIVVCLTLGYAMPVSAASPKKEVIRVGYPIQPGLTEVDEDGEFSGYTYEYLMEIAKYTNWDYEFIQADGDENTQLSTLLSMLENGEIDLMGAMTFSDELAQKMDYASYNYGTTYNVLCVSEGNTKINNSNYYTFPSLKVAVYNETHDQNAALEDFADSSGLQIEQVVYDSEEAQQAAVHNGEADALLALDIRIPGDDLRPIVSFNPRPFYFAASKKDTSIANKVNSAIGNINTFNPYFATDLKEKYFDKNREQLYLSDDEKEYIQDSSAIQVALMGGKAPSTYINASTGKAAGISVDLLEYISTKTGLEFEYNITDNYDEYEKWLESGQMDILGGIQTNEQLTSYEDYNSTAVFLSAPLVIATRKDLNPKDIAGKKLALVRGFTYDGEYKGIVNYYDSIEKCIEAVEEGKADYCYGNRYSVQYYMNKPYYSELSVYLQSDHWAQDFCMGVKKSGDDHLFSIISKGIQSAEAEGKVEDYLYSNAYRQDEFTLLSYIAFHKVYVITGAIIVILLVAVLMQWHRSRRVRERQKALIVLAQQDGLTGLYNASAYRMALEKKLAGKDESGRSALLIMDIDQFKKVNDTYGHYVGDEALREYAKAVKDIFSGEDVIGRLGGDEFGVYIDKIQDAEAVKHICTKFLGRLSQVRLKGIDHILTASIGIVIFGKEREFEELYKYADKKLYEVKNHGRNGFDIVEMD